MRIKSLEMKGFKSFCDRTYMDFPTGITAIVGPNGCGKSNAVDAIRWVLGEQSAKDLRGRVMEDVIFNGTPKEKPLNLAEINLTFTNEDGDAPEAYAHFTEIMITRRLYRSGESEYLINRVPCRRRDIIEIFMGTGIGKNAYSIVEQGKVESLISVRPEERRAFIEEASGISRYRSQREATLRRLENTRANLLRLSDIEQELIGQINALQRQARRARKYKKIRQEIRQIELGSLVAQYKTGCREITCLEEQLQKVRDEEISLSNKLQTEEMKLEEVRLRLLESDREIASTQQQIYDINAQIQKIDSQLNMIDRRSQDLKETHGRQDMELQELIKRLGQDGIRIESLKAEATEIEKRSLQCQKDLEKALSQYEDRRVGMDQLVNELEQIKTEQARGEAHRSRLEAELDSLTRQLKEEKEHRESYAQQIAQIQEEIEEVSQKLRDVKLRIEQYHNSKRHLNERYEQSNGDLVNIASKLSEISEKLDSTRQLLSGKISRLQSLKEFEARYEWCDRGVQEVMRLWKSAQPADGSHPLVADIFRTEPQFEAALEAALGQMLQFVVIDNPREGIQVIELLKSRAAGHVGFVPLYPRHRKNEQVHGTAKGNGVLGPLMERVEVADPYQPLGRALLGDFLLVQDLPTALAIWEGEGQTQPMVTLDGDVLTPMGAISGGKCSDRGRSIFYRKRQIRELGKEVEALRLDCEQLQQELNVLHQQQKEALHSVEKCREELQREDIRLATAMKDRSALEDILRRLTDRQQSMNQQQDSSRALIARLMGEIDKHTGQEEAINSKMAGLKLNIEKLAELVREGHRINENLGAEVTRLKIERTSLKQSNKNLEENLVKMEALRDEGNQRAQRLEEAQKTMDSELAEMVEARGRLEGEKESLVNRQLKLQKEVESRRELFHRDSQELEQREDGCKRLRKELNDLTSQRASHLNLELSRVQINLKHLEERVEERHGAALSEIAPDFNIDGFDLENARARLEHLRDELERLGEVNLMADSQLEELQQRHSHLSEQRTDLVKAMEDLEKTIARIDRETRQRFMETFNEVNRQFGEIFPVLFDGGRGELILTGNGGDPLDSGVDLVVQPPGKKLQSISLLSGGEKALAAIALVFALFLVRRSPLCLLDEADAPLDDVNVERFVTLLRKYGSQSQFIMVTHNKRTMAIADTLYGITMEEPGISKLVSVRLNNKDRPGHNSKPERISS